MAPRILIFSIAMGADSFYMKSIATYAPAFLMYNNSVLARVICLYFYLTIKIILISSFTSFSLFLCIALV